MPNLTPESIRRYKMKKLVISILFLVTSVSIMHLSGVFRFRQMFDHANAARVSQERLPIFDTHVHYKEPAWEVYPPDTIINLLKKSGVVKALVSSTRMRVRVCSIKKILSASFHFSAPTMMTSIQAIGT